MERKASKLEEIARSGSPWQIAIRRLLSDWVAVVSLVFIGVTAIIALLGYLQFDIAIDLLSHAFPPFLILYIVSGIAGMRSLVTFYLSERIPVLRGYPFRTWISLPSLFLFLH